MNADNADVLALKDKNPNVLTFSASGNDADLKAENVTPAENGVRLSIFVVRRKLMRSGKLDLIVPVMTSTDGR